MTPIDRFIFEPQKLSDGSFVVDGRQCEDVAKAMVEACLCQDEYIHSATKRIIHKRVYSRSEWEDGCFLLQEYGEWEPHHPIYELGCGKVQRSVWLFEIQSGVVMRDGL